MELAPAERVVFNQIHFPTLAGVFLRGSPADMAIVSPKLSSGILSPISHVRLVTGYSPAKGNSPGLSVGVIEGL